MALSSRRSCGGVPLFLNAVAPATINRASVVLRAQPKQPLFWPPRRETRGGRRSGAASQLHRRSRATAGDGDDDDNDKAPSSPFSSHLVRLATREDLPALAAIERACGHYEWGPEALRHELESPLATLLVAEARGEEGGGGGGRPGRRSLPSPSWTEGGGGDDSDKENEEQQQQQQQQQQRRPAGPSSAPVPPPPPPPGPSSPRPSSSPISGLAIVWTVADETQVLELAVHPSRRRRGASRALLAAALASSPAAAAAEAAGAGAAAGSSSLGGGRAVLEVASRNEAAISLYRSFGFGVDGVRKGYYRDGDDALLMSLRIGGGGAEAEEEEEEEEPRGRRRRSDDSAPSSPPTPPG